MKEWSVYPAQWGGGIFCNSGCYGCGVEKKLKYIDFLTEHGEVVRILSKELGFAFRTSSLKRGELKGIILRAYFDISQREDKNLLLSLAEKNKENRTRTQDSPAQNLGSTVNTSGYKNNFKNFIISQIVRVYTHITSNRRNHYLLRKELTCLLYGAKKVSKYISDKRMNCFIWKDENAESAFSKYVTMMDNVYNNCTLEIIIKEEEKL